MKPMLLSVFLLSMMGLITISPVLAQQTYTQPMFSIAWTSRTILVAVPDNPAWAKAAFANATEVWNEAQQWFIASYEPNHPNALYTLALAQMGQKGQVEVQYVNDTGQKWSGLTYDLGTRISIVLTRFPGEVYGPIIQFVAEHELGHTLGLADNCIPHDLMFNPCNGAMGLFGPYNISTLDLYATYVQALSGGNYGNGDSVTLPAQIPYAEWSPNAVPVPEFPNSVLLLVVVIGLSGVFGFRRKQRQLE